MRGVGRTGAARRPTPRRRGPGAVSAPRWIRRERGRICAGPVLTNFSAQARSRTRTRRARARSDRLCSEQRARGVDGLLRPGQREDVAGAECLARARNHHRPGRARDRQHGGAGPAADGELRQRVPRGGAAGPEPHHHRLAQPREHRADSRTARPLGGPPARLRLLASASTITWAPARTWPWRLAALRQNPSPSTRSAPRRSSAPGAPLGRNGCVTATTAGG